MSKDLEIIKEKITQNKEYLRETYGVEEIGVFGSFASGDELVKNNLVYKAVLMNFVILIDFVDVQYLQTNLSHF